MRGPVETTAKTWKFEQVWVLLLAIRAVARITACRTTSQVRQCGQVWNACQKQNLGPLLEHFETRALRSCENRVFLSRRLQFPVETQKEFRFTSGLFQALIAPFASS